MLYFQEFLQIFGCFLLLVALVVVVVILPGASIRNYCAWINGSAEIERLRLDLPRVGELSDEDAIGQATEWNQKIASWRRWNRVPVICLLIPNGWDETEFIEIPKE